MIIIKKYPLHYKTNIFTILKIYQNCIIYIIKMPKNDKNKRKKDDSDSEEEEIVIKKPKHQQIEEIVDVLN